ncbi:hypothetical protein TanjilG_21880 [Lupinus angustifolius]|uniref:Uncharacterized protein n=1 Tax=Lupinus angustifolius TaxID=3871 RepID=A0A1J7FN73_LUPAN|nr:hypothetical protein TanjilG_21880 [Lupinus angustifolius]
MPSSFAILGGSSPEPPRRRGHVKYYIPSPYDLHEGRIGSLEMVSLPLWWTEWVQALEGCKKKSDAGIDNGSRITPSDQCKVSEG